MALNTQSSLLNLPILKTYFRQIFSKFGEIWYQFDKKFMICSVTFALKIWLISYFEYKFLSLCQFKFVA